MTSPLSAADEARIHHLVAVFRSIGEERMKDLGLYNPDLQVEAVGFRRWEGWLAGVLVTPWFMNFLLLPSDDPATSLDGVAVGSRRRIAMPKGEVIFLVGDGEELGLYLSNSIISPMGQFADHPSASTAAWAAVGPYFLEPGQQPDSECGFGWGVNKGA
ncbi:[NiFe]-hydrogenase assembly, chaperone, HybE [Paramagnetospirillum kuznetsovii]|uniref:[NiFe]-hydrogenase assembly, chaperone, HybE n=1 Tax=Paramagnetospirillum kuznetsovii TaxID=2053833 RepID=A0A364NYV2_9PROT|nr:[NiFe]-hydrogenase assembly chaperone HybE [Paramagnetospirillum kuznetsovii]RAU22223.1 [NiFe]-hydrogenase assembly, chaperone, HybE [Paramagnetospirillum kuznetsovii]